MDAVRTLDGSREPGTLVRVQVGQREIPPEVEAALAAHGLGFGDPFGAPAVEGRGPRIVFLGLEIGGSAGPLSHEVRQALPGLVVVIENEVSRLLNERA